MAWVKVGEMQRICGDYTIAKNHCSASNLQFALLDKNGKFIKQFERYDEALEFFGRMKNG